MAEVAAGSRAFDERLLDVVTPGDYALAPDGRTLVWTTYGTVDDVGRHFPSDVWLGGLDDAPVRLTAGRSAAWSPDGTQVAFASDRITPCHALPYVMSIGGEPRLVATLHGSAESVAWSVDGGRLLVAAADPGSYALDWSARFTTGADGVAPRVRTPGDARRRLFLIDVTDGGATEMGPPELSV